MNGSPYLSMLSEQAGGLTNRIRQSLVTVNGRHHGAGAGVIWTNDGMILTNAHVVNHHDPQVILPDGSSVTGRLIERDPEIDLALIKIEVGNLSSLSPAVMGSVRVGEIAFAIGHPWGNQGYVTAGIVSALGKFQVPHSGRTIPVIRTDAVLAPGNSGGPLVNAAGELIGINTMIIGGDQGMAIAAEAAERLVQKVTSRAVRP
jgi:serine protease Do